VLKDIIKKVGYDYNIDIKELEVPLDHIRELWTFRLKSGLRL
jgi:REP element-mobilizing transposase RayT